MGFIKNFFSTLLTSIKRMTIFYLLLTTRSSATEKISVSYVVYPQHDWLDCHFSTAVAHLVHTGLLLEFQNDTFIELHYGQHQLGGWPQSSVLELKNEIFSPTHRRAKYSLAALPYEIDYFAIKKEIDCWNKKDYWFGRYDSWSFVEWFAEKLHKRPSELDGPIGTYLHSAKRRLRDIPLLVSHLHDLYLSPGDKIRNILNSLYIILYEEQDYYFITYVSLFFEKYFKTFRKEVFEIPMRQLLSLGVSLPVVYLLTISCLCRCTCVRYYQNRRNPSILLNRLNKLTTEKNLGPKQFLENSAVKYLRDKESVKMLVEVSQHISRIPSKFIRASSKTTEEYITSYFGHRITSIIFSNETQTNKLFFYIPGTGSIGMNYEVEMITASHLAYALDAKVIMVNHRLSPQIQWPCQFYDVCEAVIAYLAKHKNYECGITGYSTGGLLATLVTTALCSFGYKIKDVILFAPLLDFTDEFWNVAPYLNPNHDSEKYLPSVLVRSTEALNKIRKNSYPCPEIKQFYNRDFFIKMLKTCFNKEQLASPYFLRKYSPNWWKPQIYKKVGFPPTLIITGEHDFFRLDTEIMAAQLQEANIKVLKLILPKVNHKITWKFLYPVYLSQLINYFQQILVSCGSSPVIEYKAINNLLQKEKEIKNLISTLNKSTIEDKESLYTEYNMMINQYRFFSRPTSTNNRNNFVRTEEYLKLNIGSI